MAALCKRILGCLVRKNGAKKLSSGKIDGGGGWGELGNGVGVQEQTLSTPNGVPMIMILHT